MGIEAAITEIQIDLDSNRRGVRGSSVADDTKLLWRVWLSLTLSLFFCVIPAFWVVPASAALYAHIDEIPEEVIDRDRSVRRQSEARTEALAAIREGVAAGRPQVALEYLGDASGMVRDATFDQLKKMSTEQISQVIEEWPRHPLRKAAPQKRSLIEAGLAEVLYHHPNAEAESWLFSIASSRKQEEGTRELALAALGQLPSNSLKKKTLQGITRLAEREPSWWVRGEALLCLCEHDQEAAAKAVAKAWQEKKSLPMRLISLRAQALLEPKTAIGWAQSLLSEEIKDRKGIWKGRLERGALSLIGEEGAQLPRAERAPYIDGLIARALEASGRSWVPEIPALKKLSEGALDSNSVIAWDSWWRSRRDEWIQGQPTATGETSQGEATKKDEPGQTKVVEYHGVPIDSRRIVFVSDVSGGMSRNLAGDFNGPGPLRLEVARAELLRVLGELPAEALVQVIYFASLRIPVLPAPQLLGRCHKVLKKRIGEQGVPQGRGEARGNLYAPLRAALFEPGVDTVMLLTEGAATEGRIHDGDRLLWHVSRWNRWAQVRLHVLSVGRLSGGNRSFLEKLARDHRGEFHDIDDRFREPVRAR
ncbi:MAG: hypothetical protein CBC13_01145 [Planctomycetia bacterium TMED53]|nr:MAG: hypothetical protein CBC13_01145 [Planctomycetia bacterium TMED53]